LELSRSNSRLIIKCIRNRDNKYVALKFCRNIEAACELQVLEDFGGKHGIIQLYDSLPIPQSDIEILVLDYHNNEHYYPTTNKDLISFIKQTIKTVEFLRRQMIIHCDLKPSNFLVDPDMKVTLIDFGLSVNLMANLPPEEFRGTIKYAAPEVLANGKTTSKVDSWGLGITFAELILNQSPLFHSNTQEGVLLEIEQFHKNIDEWKMKVKAELFDEKIWALIIQLLQVDPKNRISTKDARLLLKEHFPNSK